MVYSYDLAIFILTSKTIIMKILETGTSFSTNYPLGIKMSRDSPLVLDLIEKFKEIEEYKDKKINLFCTGSSGAIMATIFSLNVPQCKIIHIKKEGENSHSSNEDRSVNKIDHINIIIDDFISTGKTVNRIAGFMSSNEIAIHCLVISGYSYHNSCKFTMDYIICGKEKEN